MSWRKLLKRTADYLERARNPWVLPEERLLFSFSEESSLQSWTTFQDRDLGGQSTAELNQSNKHPGTAVLSGNFSSEIDKGLAAKLGSKLQRSGFAGITSKEGAYDFEQLDEYDALVFRVFGDGRKYIANIRTDNWMIGTKSDDVWQALVLASWKGKLVEDQHEMNPARIMSVGLAIAGDKINPPGRYELGLEWIRAKRLRSVLVDGKNL